MSHCKVRGFRLHIGQFLADGGNPQEEESMMSNTVQTTRDDGLVDYSYNDGRTPGGRYPRLWLVTPDGVAHRFEGQTIPTVVVVERSTFEKRGQWSNSTYALLHPPGVRPLHMLAPLHQQWGDEYGSWRELADDFFQKYGLGYEEAVRVVRRSYKFVSDRLDGVEAALDELLDSQGSPTDGQVLRLGTWVRSFRRDTFGHGDRVEFEEDGLTIVLEYQESESSPAPGVDDWKVISPPGVRITRAHRPVCTGRQEKWEFDLIVPADIVQHEG